MIRVQSNKENDPRNRHTQPSQPLPIDVKININSKNGKPSVELNVTKNGDRRHSELPRTNRVTLGPIRDGGSTMGRPASAIPPPRFSLLTQPTPAPLGPIPPLPSSVVPSTPAVNQETLPAILPEMAEIPTVKSLAETIFPKQSSFTSVVRENQSNPGRARAPKTDQKDQILQLHGIVTKMKTAMKEWVACKDKFLVESSKSENKLHALVVSKSHQISEVESAKKVLEAELKKILDGKKELQTDYQKLMLAVAQLKERLQQAKQQVEATNARLAATQEAEAVLKKQLESKIELIASLEEDLKSQVLAFREAETKNQEALQHLQDLTKTRKEHQESLESRLAHLEGQLVSANRTIEQLRTQYQESSVMASGLRVEMARAQEKATLLEKERDSVEKERNNYIAQSENLKLSVERKNSEFSAALTSFSKSQLFHEERTKSLVSEKEKLEEKLLSLRNEKNHLREEVERFKEKYQVEERKLHEARNEIEMLRSRADILEKEMTTAKSELQQQISQAVSLQAQLSTSQQAWERHKAEWERHKADIVEESQKQAYQHKIEFTELQKKNLELDKEVAILRERSEQLSSIKQTYEAENVDLKQRITEKMCEVNSFKKLSGVAQDKQLDNIMQLSLETEKLKAELADKQRLEAELKKKDQMISQLKKQVFEGESTRRQLHNAIQELRGNIRVMTRIRPLSEEEKAEEKECPLECEPTGNKLHVLSEPDNSGARSRLYSYDFDRVITSQEGQAVVFQEVSHFVQSALDGYKVCLFSYGQTGSGKTYTMQGLNGKHQQEERGIIPRSIEKVMESAKKLAEQGWEYKMEVSYLEIYNETLRDLLDPNSEDNVVSEDVREEMKGSESKGLAIKHDANGVPYVHGLTRIAVKGPHQIDSLMARAAKERAVACTNMNAKSSRSHAVFTLYLHGTNQKQGVVLQGSLNLCDLAGSERLSRSKAVGQQLKETQAINKSLSCLGDVFAALASKAQHVPYRNSKLTHLLQSCFSKNGKTLMLVNLSPTGSSKQESQCSLQFAARVSQVELGAAKKQVGKLGSNNSVEQTSNQGTSATTTKDSRKSLVPSKVHDKDPIAGVSTTRISTVQAPVRPPTLATPTFAASRKRGRTTDIQPEEMDLLSNTKEKTKTAKKKLKKTSDINQ